MLCSNGLLVPKQALKPGRRELGVAHRVLDRFVAEIGLDRTGIDAIIRQLKSTGMAEHMRVDFHFETGSLTGTLKHGLKAPLREWRPALTHEHVRRFALAL